MIFIYLKHKVQNLELFHIKFMKEKYKLYFFIILNIIFNYNF